jgi:hypothetical protein
MKTDWLTPNQVLAQFPIKRTALAERTAAGDIPSCKKGRSRIYRRLDLEAYFTTGRRDNGAATDTLRAALREELDAAVTRILTALASQPSTINHQPTVCSTPTQPIQPPKPASHSPSPSNPVSLPLASPSRA